MARRRVLLGLGCLAVAILAACGGKSPASDESSSAQDGRDETATVDDARDDDPAGAQDEVPADYDFSEVSQVVEAFIDENGLNGAGLVVVDRDDGVIHEDYWGEFDEDRISLVASSSKMITAGVLARLDDDGLLDLDAPVADVVEWGSAKPDITPAQLISNSSGLVGLLDALASVSGLCQFVATGTLQDCAESIFTSPDDDAEVVPPDTEFRYGGGQWQVAGAVAEAASGNSWAELVDEIYVQPCGLEALGYNNHFIQFTAAPFEYPEAFGGDPSTLQPTENPNMEAGVYITAGDYGELLLMHLRGGVCGENQVLSQEALDRMHSDRILDVYGGDAIVGERSDGEVGQGQQGYGMGWWVDRGTGMISDGGAYGSVPWLDLGDGYGAYLVIEADSLTGQSLAGELKPIVEQAVIGS